MTPSTAATHVALLRGINVGGKNRIVMSALVAAFEDAGCSDVRTYVQSGNVVFRAPARTAARLPREIAAHLAEHHGLTVPVVLRTVAELEGVARANPFLARGVDAALLHVAFLAAQPAKAAVAGLDPRRSPPDELVVAGREVYLHLPNGVARSRLTNAWLDAQLATISTLRNWRTVGELVALARGAGA
jgi:uncharacterized protein (DUF1697 family)